jgi:hypothetical protein
MADIPTRTLVSRAMVVQKLSWQERQGLNPVVRSRLFGDRQRKTDSN